MRLIFGSILILLFVVNPVYGQLTELRVDSTSMSGDDIAEVIIGQDGVVEITSVAGNYEIRQKTSGPGDVAINSFSINTASNAVLAVNAAATLRWGTSDAVSCTASSSPVDALGDWNSTTVMGIAGPLTVNFPQAGILNIQLDCTGDNGSTDSKVVTAQVGSANISSFTITPSSATRGTNVTLTATWASDNTAGVGCAGSSNWPNSTALASSGSVPISVNNIQPGTQYTLTCFGEFDEDSKTIAIAVKEPQLVCSTTLTSDTTRDWTSIFREEFPGPSSEQVRITIPTRGYYAVKFNTGDLSDAGFLTNIEASGTSGYRYGSVSQCPGDFNVKDECQHKWGDTGGIFWDTDANDGRCILEQNTTYYWNMTFTDGAAPNSSRCIGSFCETYLQVSNR
jgi:hypothetical protein